MSELPRERLAFRHPANKQWVIEHLDLLISEWRAWEQEVEQLGKDPEDRFDPRPGNVLADGEENIRKHRILQSKTLEFLDQHIMGHGFISGRDGTHVDRTDLRLHYRVKHRLEELDDLHACLQYAGNEIDQVPSQHRTELLTLRPGIWGISFDIKEAWRRIQGWWRRRANTTGHL